MSLRVAIQDRCPSQRSRSAQHLDAPEAVFGILLRLLQRHNAVHAGRHVCREKPSGRTLAFWHSNVLHVGYVKVVVVFFIGYSRLRGSVYSRNE